MKSATKTELTKPEKPLPATWGVEVPEDLVSLDAPALKQELSRSLAMTANNLRRLAAIVRLLEEKGEDLSDLRIGLLEYLRKIAYGQVLSETVVRFSEWPRLMRLVSSLPGPDQERLAGGDSVVMVVRREDGSFTTRRADPLRLTTRQIAQVFGLGKIRDEAEQILYLEDRGKPPEPSGPRKALRVGRVTADPKRGGLKIGKGFAPVADIIGGLAALSPEPDMDSDDPADSTLVLKLTEAQHASLKIAAARGGTDMQSLVRRTLAAAGLLSQQ